MTELIVTDTWLRQTTMSSDRLEVVATGAWNVKTCDHPYGSDCRCLPTDRLLRVKVKPYGTLPS